MRTDTTGDGGSGDGADELMTDEVPHADGLVQTGRNQVHCG